MQSDPARAVFERQCIGAGITFYFDVNAPLGAAMLGIVAHEFCSTQAGQIGVTAAIPLGIETYRGRKPALEKATGNKSIARGSCRSPRVRFRFPALRRSCAAARSTFRFSVYLGPQQDEVYREPQPGQKHHHGAQQAVNSIVVTKM